MANNIQHFDVIDANNIESVFKFKVGANHAPRAVVGHFGTNGEWVELQLWRDANSNGRVDRGDKLEKRSVVTGDGAHSRFVVATLASKGKNGGKYLGVLKGDAGAEVFFDGKIQKLFGKGKTKIVYRDRVQTQTIEKNHTEYVPQIQYVDRPVEKIVYVDRPGTTPAPSQPTDPLAPTGTFTATVSNIQIDADYVNTIGYYQVQNEQGDVLDPLTGATVKTTDFNYRDAALRASQELGKGFSFSANTTAPVTATLLDGRYASFIVADSTVDRALTGDSKGVFFSFAVANSTGTGYVLPPNSVTSLSGDWAFEDGFDSDLNDVRFTIAASK